MGVQLPLGIPCACDHLPYGGSDRGAAQRALRSTVIFQNTESSWYEGCHPIDTYVLTQSRRRAFETPCRPILRSMDSSSRFPSSSLPLVLLAEEDSRGCMFETKPSSQACQDDPSSLVIFLIFLFAHLPLAPPLFPSLLWLLVSRAQIPPGSSFSSRRLFTVDPATFVFSQSRWLSSGQDHNTCAHPTVDPDGTLLPG